MKNGVMEKGAAEHGNPMAAFSGAGIIEAWMHNVEPCAPWCE